MFKIEVEFKDWLGRHEFKTESTDNWIQAFGAFTIYVSDNDCIFAKSLMITKNVYWTIRRREAPLKS